LEEMSGFRVDVTVSIRETRLGYLLRCFQIILRPRPSPGQGLSLLYKLQYNNNITYICYYVKKVVVPRRSSQTQTSAQLRLRLWPVAVGDKKQLAWEPLV